MSSRYCQPPCRPPPERSYNSSRRTLEAAQTADDGRAGRHRRFSATGWAGTTLADIAAAAGVSVETIYKGFGSKKALLRAAIDFSVVGDAAPVPLSERPEYLALGEGRSTSASPAPPRCGHHPRPGGRRVGGAGGGGQRRRGDRRLAPRDGPQSPRADRPPVAALVGRSLVDRVTTMGWILYSSETYLRVVQDLGCTQAEYEAFLVDAPEADPRRSLTRPARVPAWAAPRSTATGSSPRRSRPLARRLR